MGKKRIRPLNDFVFKEIMGRVGQEDVLKSFLNAALKDTSSYPITEVTIEEDTEIRKRDPEDKKGVIDVKAKTGKDEIINIEVQLVDKYNMKKRTVFYGERLQLADMKEGQDYSELKRTIAINIINYTLFPQIEKYHTRFNLREVDYPEIILTDVLEVHFFEHNKFRKKKNTDFKDDIDRWMTILREDIDENIVKELVTIDPIMERVENKLEFYGKA